MWKLLEQAAKTATANASEYVSTVQEKAQTLVATVQDEAATLLHAISSARTGPVDELLYEEIDDYKAFCDKFKIDAHTDEISQILEEDDEIREFHEQMVPVQLSYEEFWSRYFFRREQAELREKREAERKKKQLEKEEAKAAAKAVLEEFDVDDDDEEEFDASPATGHTVEDANDDTEDAPARDKADAEEDEATLAQLKEMRANRKAAMQWKQKALEYQKQLGVLAAKHEDEKQQLTTTKEDQYQSLCDSYEAKMTEVTMQIDDARAIGYNEGIQESEAIVATMRQEADAEISRLKLEIAQLQQQGLFVDNSDSANAGAGASMAELGRLMDALTLKEQVVTALEEQKSELERALAEKEEALQKAVAQIAQTNAASPAPAVDGEEAKKEIELWKVRALKMKKLKDQVDAELQQLKEEQLDQGGTSSSADVAGLQAKVTELEQHNASLSAQISEAFAKGKEEGAMRAQAEVAELSARLEASQKQLDEVAKQEFERGVDATRKQTDPQLQELREQVEKATLEGEAKAAATYNSEIELLRSELAVLRAQRQHVGPASPPTGDVLAQADAMLSSLTSPSLAAMDANQLLDDTWAVDSDAPTAAAAPPDWGEW